MGDTAGGPTPLTVRNSGRWLGNDGSWSTFYVNAGTPPQYFDVLPSFGDQTIYVPKSDDCARMSITDCGASRGVQVFNSKVSLGFQTNASSSWVQLGIYKLGIGSIFGFDGNALYGYDRAGISLSNGVNNNVTLDRQAVGAYVTPDPWLGRVGLSPYAITVNETEKPRSLLQALKAEGFIPSLSFGYQAGAAHRFTKVPGSLVLGGYDQSRRSNDSITVPSTTDVTVGLQSIAINLQNATLTALDVGVLTVLDTAVPELWLPPLVCDQIATALNLTYQEEYKRYTLNTTAHTAIQLANPTFQFRIGTGVNNSPSITIEIPYKAFDLEASYPFFGSPQKYFPLRRADNDTQYALGRVFLSEVYMVVDWEQDVFNISQAIFSAPMPEPNIIAIPPKLSRTTPLDSGPNGSGSGDKLAAGAIAGIVIGIVLLLAGIVLGLWFWRRKHKREKTSRYPGALQAMQHAEEDEKKGSVEAGVGNRREADVELEGDQRHVVEMHVPSKAHEMGHSTDDNVLVEAEVPTVVHEMPDNDPSRR